jgi:hypothetical protein
VNLSYAINYPFQDSEWVSKLAITAAIAFVSIITTPILVGLIGWAALLGYYIALIRNLRDNHPTPLPRWDRYEEKISQGGSVLTAGIVYALPNLLMACCFATTSSFLGESFANSLLNLGMTCCLLPVLMVYNLVTWPMLALGAARYAEERNIGVFFQFGDLFDTARRNFTPTLQWMIYTFILNLVIGVVAAVPCIGWAVAPALLIPIQGYFTAAYADQIESPAKKKR